MMAETDLAAQEEAVQVPHTLRRSPPRPHQLTCVAAGERPVQGNRLSVEVKLGALHTRVPPGKTAELI